MCEHCGRYRAAYVWQRGMVMRLCAPCFWAVLHNWQATGRVLLPVKTAPLPREQRAAYLNMSTIQVFG